MPHLPTPCELETAEATVRATLSLLSEQAGAQAREGDFPAVRETLAIMADILDRAE